MNKHHVKGAVKSAKGRVKEEIGHATGNTSLEGEGMLERVAGRVEKTVGDAKDAVKRKVDKLFQKDSDRRERA